MLTAEWPTWIISSPRRVRDPQVRGILNKEEVVMAKSSLSYLAGVHLVVATPAALMEAVREPEPAAQLLRHLKVGGSLGPYRATVLYAYWPRAQATVYKAAVWF